ncbi:MAG: hypothetical protein KBC41_02520 [Candidatus Pacebacteria bacterium]|nr:hypothetical protein [Candidatus Paceibacterota bacterium]MBP9866928.1 hypothetical protein [Candidatus Paceibacterota bacterium]
MNTFILYLRDGRVMASQGHNMIDACFRSSSCVNYKEVQSYREGNSERRITFAQ